MSSLAHLGRPAVYRVVAVAAVALLLITTFLATVASAHGSVINPPSRNYGCWQRWGSDFQSQRMATEDPMCWQAWRADPSAMWNWNGLYREGVAGNHQGAIPDGQLCSGGQTFGTRYASLDNPGAWRATDVNNSFTLTMHDQARHGADYIRVYVTRQGYNPLTQRLRWADLELVRDTGRILPGVGETTTNPALNGVSISTPVNAPGRTGRHIVYTIWQASHSDQSYYICSDVNFPGGSGGTPTTPPSSNPTTPPSSSPTTPPSSSPTTPPSSSPTTPPASPSTPPAGGTASCSATYTVTGQWTGGFQGSVRVTAAGAPIRGWTVNWTFPNGQQVASVWGATVTSNGSAVTARNVNYNGSLGAGGSTTFGFIGSSTAAGNGVPALTCTATA